MAGASARRAILPFFIPMCGCSYRCVYCDQQSISGADQAPAPAAVAAELDAYTGPPVQVAFYGGSFSALPQAWQLAYLRAVQPALAAGKVESLRISTRPDALDTAKLELLQAYGVRLVELGIQSFDRTVLAAAGRPYQPQEAVAACQLVQSQGLELGIQLMTGLPGDTRTQALRSMEQACALRPDLLRIYPTLVLRDTPLAALYQSGGYTPQSLDEAAALAADMLALAAASAIPVARLGLNPTPSLEAALIAGPYHPAFGQFAKGALKLRQAQTLLQQQPQPCLLLFPPRERSLLFGQRNQQWQLLTAAYPGLRAEAAELPPGALAARFADGSRLELSQPQFLRQYVADLWR